MLSIIIPTCNRNDLLAMCLDCLNPQFQTINAANYEVIVTDDSKQNRARQFIKENYTWVKWIAGPQRGPAANRNNGARNAKGEWLIFIDDDCLPDKQLLEIYQTAILSNEKILVFEGCIKTDRVQQSLAEESPVNETGGYLWSCNFMINKKIFLHDLNGFDEKFPFAAMEDVDLDYRLSKSGFSKVFLKNAYVVHPWRVQKKMWTITLNRFKSTLYFLKKHPEKKKEINSKYYFIAFFNGFFKNTLKNAFKYKFKGFFSKVNYDILQLYFSVYISIYNRQG
ncbi:glycosyltransferase family 2 protein [Mucilaginibacter arboris]|uniref:Glycosyltransferase n=1 Tax=Mucilaginibacter arboris TaxID=2682090 RepID=A0A7K1SYA0_9SPHI|nr:glycosyltransferase [Mucilaginibacter arboris]MVN22227.1 glycosyltransferase [Mucilaginibacter arboris]